MPIERFDPTHANVGYDDTERIRGRGIVGAGRVDWVVETSLAGLGAHASAWDELARRALDDNLYLGRAFVSAMLRHHDSKSETRIVFLYEREGGVEGAADRPFESGGASDASRRLIAVAGFSVADRSLALPISGLTTLESPHGYLSFPLIDRDAAGDALSGLFDYLESQSREFDYVSFRDLPERSRLWPLFQEEARRRKKRLWIKERRQRALFRRMDSFEAYLASLGSRRRRSYQRRLRRLHEECDVEIRLHRGKEACPDLAGRFMQLESRSWKGNAGTALAASGQDQKFLEEWVASLERSDSLFCVEILANGEPIAITLNFSQGRTLFAFKVAYDPAFSRFSPGIIAEIETLRFFLETGDFDRADSGTAGVSYIDEYWNDSTEMLFVLWPLGRRIRGLKLRTLEGLTDLKRVTESAASRLVGKGERIEADAPQ